MKHTYFRIILFVVTLLGLIIPALPVAAAGASISLVANKTTVAPGSSLIVAVYMNGGGTPINAVEADLTYPASQLQYVGINYNGGAFSINTPTNGGGNGSVSIQNGTVTPISGSALIATVTFKALASSGTANINVASSSNLINANDNSTVPYFGKGTSVKFGTVATSTSTSSAPAAPAPPVDTTAPIISAISLHNISPLGITLQWTTNEPADSVVDFGLDTTYGLSSSAAGRTTTHNVVLANTFLTPKTLFHYHVKSTDSNGNVATSADKVFTLPGIPVTVSVRGPNGKALAGASVTLDNSSGSTNKQGTVVLPSGIGNKKITVQYGGVSVQKAITVERSAKALPAVHIDLGPQPLNRWAITALTLLVIVISLIAIDAVLFGSHFFARLAGIRRVPSSESTSSEPSPVLPVENPAAVVAAVSEPTFHPAQHLTTAIPVQSDSNISPKTSDAESHLPLSPEKLATGSQPPITAHSIGLRQPTSKKPAVHHKKTAVKRSAS